MNGRERGAALILAMLVAALAATVAVALASEQQRWFADVSNRRDQVQAQSLVDAVAATSVGIVGGESLLDLCYEEDSRAEVDMTVVMTATGRFVELQATAERTPFDDGQLNGLLSLAQRGIHHLLAAQQSAFSATA